MDLANALATKAAADARLEQRLSTLPGVVLIDDLLPPQQREAVNAYLRAGGWKFGWKSSSKKDMYSFWHRHFAGHHNGRKEAKYDCSGELRNVAPLMFAFWRLLERDIFPGHTLVRCYANAHAYGSDGTIHTDSRLERSYTSVYYPHQEWHPSWGGETVIFNHDQSDILSSIYPRPNRLAVFKGNHPHVARGVSRICPELRVTLMFKTVEGTLDAEEEDK